MFYKSELGMQGNVELALQRIQKTSKEAFDEACYRTMGDTENREAVEQVLTDQFLDLVQAQQDITELQLEILGG